MEKINKLYKNTYLIISTITVLMILLVFKKTYYGLYNLKLSELKNTEQIIANVVYIIFAITTSLSFFIKHKPDSLEEFTKYLKLALIGLGTIIVYKITPILELAILYYSRIDVSKMSITAKTIFLIICETSIMLIIILINRNKLKENIKRIKHDYNKHFSKCLKYYILALIIMIISNLIINKLTGSIAANEETIRTTFNKAPVYIFFSAVVFAPFVEEMVFRNSIKNIIKNKKTFIIISGLIFGGAHIIGNITTIYDVLYIIPYGAPGIILAYMLAKTDNIFLPMGIHFLHNGLLMTLQLIPLFLK